MGFGTVEREHGHTKAVNTLEGPETLRLQRKKVETRITTYGNSIIILPGEVQTLKPKKRNESYTITSTTSITKKQLGKTSWVKYYFI